MPSCPEPPFQLIWDVLSGLAGDAAPSLSADNHYKIRSIINFLRVFPVLGKCTRQIALGEVCTHSYDSVAAIIAFFRTVQWHFRPCACMRHNTCDESLEETAYSAGFIPPALLNRCVQFSIGVPRTRMTYERPVPCSPISETFAQSALYAAALSDVPESRMSSHTVSRLSAYKLFPRDGLESAERAVALRELPNLVGCPRLVQEWMYETALGLRLRMLQYDEQQRRSYKRSASCANGACACRFLPANNCDALKYRDTHSPINHMCTSTAVRTLLFAGKNYEELARSTMENRDFNDEIMYWELASGLGDLRGNSTDVWNTLHSCGDQVEARHWDHVLCASPADVFCSPICYKAWASALCAELPLHKAFTFERNGPVPAGASQLNRAYRRNERFCNVAAATSRSGATIPRTLSASCVLHPGKEDHFRQFWQHCNQIHVRALNTDTCLLAVSEEQKAEAVRQEKLGQVRWQWVVACARRWRGMSRWSAWSRPIRSLHRMSACSKKRLELGRRVICRGLVEPMNIRVIRRHHREILTGALH